MVQSIVQRESQSNGTGCRRSLVRKCEQNLRPFSNACGFLRLFNLETQIGSSNEFAARLSLAPNSIRRKWLLHWLFTLNSCSARHCGQGRYSVIDSNRAVRPAAVWERSEGITVNRIMFSSEGRKSLTSHVSVSLRSSPSGLAPRT